MRWLRPTVSRPDDDDEVQEIEATLEVAAQEAPPSRREEEIRADLLERVGADRRLLPGPAPVAVLAIVLALAVIVGLGASFVGSLIGESNGPPDAIPSPTEMKRPERTPLPSVSETDEASPPRSELPSPSPTVGPAEVDPPQELPRSSLPPQASPGGPPSPMPTPPRTGPP